MSTYVVGDIQGCYEEFRRLLDVVQYDDSTDELWLVGDLVNRGPNNTGVLDLIMSLTRCRVVLGNHDLHFLAVALGHQKQHRSDTMDDLISSSRLPDYISFLRQQPLLARDIERNLVMVHAGLPPQLHIDTCEQLAAEVERTLVSNEFEDFLVAMYGNEPAAWQDDLTGLTRLRVITNFLTRLRYCTADGTMELTHKAEVQPKGYAPWFSFERPDDVHILFGHWAAIEGKSTADFATALDTGCVWGRSMTALRLEDRQYFSIPAINQR